MRLLVVLCALALLPAVVAAQAKSKRAPRKPTSAASSRIVDYEYDGAEASPLRVRFSDGTTVDIAPERGRFGVDGRILPQTAFTNIQIAEGGQYIGWMADYMVCAQSYPCSAELGLFGAD